MNKILILIICVIFSAPGFCQKRIDLSYGVQTTGYFIDRTFRAVVVPQVQFSLNAKSSIGTGPIIMVATEIAPANKNFPRFTGLQAQHIYYPGHMADKVSLFFTNTILMQRISDRWTSAAWSPVSQNYISYGYQNVEYLLQYFGGYGIALKAGKIVRIRQSLGIGVYYSIADGDELTIGAPEINDKNLQGYNAFGLNYAILLAVTFDL